jgi:adenosylmethionine-8-amino-7-oxononanoate aminotransferase
MTPSPVWRPFTQHGLGEPVPEVVRTEGAALYTRDGRRVIDAISSWWVTTHGHRHPRIMRAIAETTASLDQLIFAGWTHAPAEDLARRLIDIAPSGLEHVFYSDSGSTSVEVALKMALGVFSNRGEARSRILVLDHSYHGDTIGAMSVGERGVFTAAYRDLLFEVERAPFPHAGREQSTLDAVEAFCRRPDACAFILEPLVLGAGGMLMYSPGTLRALREICALHGVFFIADEVMTGFGRTGTLFACQQAGISPDILCLSKGLTGGAIPLAATLATSEIFEAHRSTDRTKMFFHSSSYTANPIACAAGLANLDVWREEPVIQRIATLAERQGALLARLSARPDLIHPRQSGTIIALDLAADQSGYLAGAGQRLRRLFQDADVLLRPLGSTLYVLPPYCIDETDLARVGDVIEQGLDALKAGT